MTIETMYRDDMVFLNYPETDCNNFRYYSLLFRHPAGGNFYVRNGSVPDRFKISVMTFDRLFKEEDARCDQSAKSINVDTSQFAVRLHTPSRSAKTAKTPAPNIYLGPGLNPEF